MQPVEATRFESVENRVPMRVRGDAEEDHHKRGAPKRDDSYSQLVGLVRRTKILEKSCHVPALAFSDADYRKQTSGLHL